MLAGTGMSRDNQNYPMPAPTEESSWKYEGSQGSTDLWDNDRILHTKYSQTVGERGPVLHQDSTLHEALEIFYQR